MTSTRVEASYSPKRLLKIFRNGFELTTPKPNIVGIYDLIILVDADPSSVRIDQQPTLGGFYFGYGMAIGSRNRQSKMAANID
ncbi:hypothetical protein EBZ37_15450, partial [bacterium]|nr:hypothetical protein [bacterium]